MSPNIQSSLFVYGTLRGSFQNDFAEYLRNSGQLLGRGKVQGQLYAIAEYPGFILSQTEGDWVVGEVYCLHDSEMVYRILDAYECCGPDDPLPHEYNRTVLPVLLDSGKWIKAYVYIYKGDLTGKQRIETGDFLLFAQGHIKGF